MSSTRTRPGGRGVRLGLDVGGTKIDAVAVDESGQIFAQLRRASRQGADAVVDSVLEAAFALMDDAGLGVADIASVGIGVPGSVSDRGHVLHAVNLGVESLDLAGRAQAVLPVPFAVENDVKAAVLGAASLRPGAVSMAYLNLGTGVAAGIVLNGRLWRGATGNAGEVGHVSIDPSGRECGCGQRGCVETFCGGGALTRAWGRPGALPVLDIFDAADAGDPLAQQLRTGVGRGAAAAIRILALSVDVQTVVIGGGLTALGDRLQDEIRRALQTDAAHSPFIRSLRLEERFELLQQDSPVAALGAALVPASAGIPA